MSGNQLDIFEDLERPKTKFGHHSSRLPLNLLENLAPASMLWGHQISGSIQPLCTKTDPQLSRYHGQTRKVASRSYRVRLRRSPLSCCQTAGSWRIIATFRKEDGYFRYQQCDPSNGHRNVGTEEANQSPIQRFRTDWHWHGYQLWLRSWVHRAQRHIWTVFGRPWE